MTHFLKEITEKLEINFLQEYHSFFKKLHLLLFKVSMDVRKPLSKSSSCILLYFQIRAIGEILIAGNANKGMQHIQMFGNQMEFL